jgi:GTP pyrophosphokinase
MITVIAGTGIHSNVREMSTSNSQLSTNGRDQAGIVARAEKLIETLGDDPTTRQAVTEGREIATIVETLGLPADLLAAARLCPLVRENLVDTKMLEKNNLEAISRIVVDLVQLGQFSLPSEWQPGQALAGKQSEALRKMLLAVVSDVRLVLVRIAEQLHRLRNARNSSRDEQRAIALETREIYAALANRLGVWQLKWELEDLSFRYLEPDTYREIAAALREKRKDRLVFIDEVKSTLQAELDKQGVKADISGRPKHIYSIWRKMQRKDRGLDALYDIRAVRVLVDDVKDCYAALGAVHNLWSYLPGEFDGQSSASPHTGATRKDELRPQPLTRKYDSCASYSSRAATAKICWRRFATTFSRTGFTASARRAMSLNYRPAPRRWISHTTCIPRLAIAAGVRRSMAVSCP